MCVCVSVEDEKVSSRVGIRDRARIRRHHISISNIFGRRRRKNEFTCSLSAVYLSLAASSHFISSHLLSLCLVIISRALLDRYPRAGVSNTSENVSSGRSYCHNVYDPQREIFPNNIYRYRYTFISLVAETSPALTSTRRFVSL